MGDQVLEEASYGTETSVSETGMMMNVAYPLLSVLAAGISGSARLHERLGDAEASRAVDRCVKRIERSVDAFGGRIVRIGGDEVIAVFDTADAAIHASIEMHQRVADLPPVSGVKMAIRVGISCGEPASPDQAVDEDAARDAAHLAGTAKSGQTLACGSIREQIPATLLPLVSDTGSMLLNASGVNESVLEIAVPETPSAATGSAEGASRKPDATDPAGGCLRLRYAGDTVLLNERKSIVRMGRDGACDLVIHDRRASRHHAAIERRSGAVMLIDKSTNGTYVTIDGLAEQFLKHSECALRGKGVISFASSSSTPDADYAEFEFV